MAIYVDDAMILWRGKRWCHLVCDGPLADLHAFAERIGLRREWFQNKPLHPHYDVTEPMRERAIANGAIATPWREMAPILARIAASQREEHDATRSNDYEVTLQLESEMKAPGYYVGMQVEGGPQLWAGPYRKIDDAMARSPKRPVHIFYRIVNLRFNGERQVILFPMGHSHEQV